MRHDPPRTVGVFGLFGAPFSHPNFLREVGRSFCLALSLDYCRRLDLLGLKKKVPCFQSCKEAIQMTTNDATDIRNVLEELAQRLVNLGGHL